jgi:hypothetical protein
MFTKEKVVKTEIQSVSPPKHCAMIANTDLAGTAERAPSIYRIA